MAKDLAADIAAIAKIAAVPMILDVVCNITGMGFAAIARVTHEQWVLCSVQDRIAFGMQPGDELQLETTICHAVRGSRTPVVISNVQEDMVYRDHLTPAMYGFQSYLSMPIILPDGTFFGTLCAIDPSPRELDTPEIVGMFKLFAELIAFHLDAGARLASAEARLLEQHETAVVREQFIAVLGHDLRNPLQSLSSGLVQVLRKPDQTGEIVGYMQRSVARMAGLVENMLDFARGRLGNGLTVTHDSAEPLEPTLNQIIVELQNAWPNRAIMTEVHLTVPVDCDHGRIGQLFSNLLGNALTHSTTGTPVKVRAVTTDGMFELSVANQGRPIPEPLHGRLFQPFVRGEAQSNHTGLGLGLYISAEIAKAHGGIIEVVSNDTETCFTFRMPVSVREVRTCAA